MSANKRTFPRGVVCICTVAACVATAAVLAQPQPIKAFDNPGGGDCGTCTPTVNDIQVGINGFFQQACEDSQWVSLAFPVQTGGGMIDTVVSTHNSNIGEGDIYIMGGTCDGPDVRNILGVCCCGIVNAPPGVAISNTFAGGPFPTSATDPTWVVMVFRDGFSFDVALDSSTLGTPGAAYANLQGTGNPGDWLDLNVYGWGACYFVDLTLTGNTPSPCVCAWDPDSPNDECADAIVLNVPPGGSVSIDGTTKHATVDPDECVVPTTFPGVWYKVVGNGNGMTATTCAAGTTYDTKLSVFCGECPSGGLSDCCTSHSTPGCDDAACEAIVCAQDSYCCSVMWDSICAGEAASKCGDLCSGGGGGWLLCVDGNDDDLDCSFSISQSRVDWCSENTAWYYILVQGHKWGSNFTLTVSDDGVSCTGAVGCILGPEMGGCCQCDELNQQFCTIETEEDCAALEGCFLGVGEPCEADDLIYTAWPGVTIPDDDPVGVQDTITVAEAFTITDLDVDLVIDHTWLGDLCVKLQKAGGPEITLIKRMNIDAECDATGCCGCSGDNMSVILDDEATGSIEDQCRLAVTGTYSPDPDSLSDFDGLDSAGDWTICVNDNAGPDVGVLVKWSLHFSVSDTGATPCEEAYPNQCLVTGSFDIKPGSCPNSFHNKGTGNGKLPCALVGTDEIDVTFVDPDSLLLSRADGVGGFVAPLANFTHVDDVATPYDGDPCGCHELMGDGVPDLKLKFHRTTMTNVLELGDLPGNSMVELVLTGSLTNGQDFEARDCIRLVPPSWGGAN